MDSTCLDLICQKYYNRILHYCLGKTHGNVSQAEDVTSDVFYLLIQKWDSYKTHEEAAIATWLYKTANLKWMEAIHQSTGILSIDDVDPEEADLLDTMDLDYEGELLRYEQYLIDIQNELNPEEAALFRCRIIEKQNYDDIAYMFGISVRALRLRWYRLQQKLLKYLQNRGYIGSIPSLANDSY